MKQMVFCLSLVFCFLSVAVSAQQLELPSIFTSGMVLQQKDSVPVWGWGAASEKVKIVGEWNKKDTVVTTVDNQGQWKTVIKTTNAGGPYWLKVMNTNCTVTIELKDVMLGEVWLCSGQSNMEFSAGWGLKDKDKEVQNAAYNNLRIFHLLKQGADTPQNNCHASWEVASPSSMSRTSAIAYFFGRKLSKELGVPVGVIVSAWGGTPAEVWVPKEKIMADPILSKCTLKDYPWWPKKPGVLYNQMIAPFVPYKIAGCIWYQGESNHLNATSYGRLMKTLIESWRQEFKTSFPFLLFQIAPYTYKSEHNTPALLREQQEWLEHHVENTKMINVSDLVDNVKDIHPKDKRGAGERMTNLALTTVYHKQGYANSHPKFDTVTYGKKNAVITFKDGNGRIVNRGKAVVGITAFVDGKWVEAKVLLRKNKLIVSSPKGQKIEAIRYCFDDATVGSLMSAEGLPVLPFRTDHFGE